MSTVNIAQDLGSSLKVGSTTVGTSAVQVIPANYSVLKGVQLKAHPDNTDPIFIGTNTVSSASGFPLSASEGLFVPIEDLSKIYAIAGAANQDLRWAAV